MRWDRFLDGLAAPSQSVRRGQAGKDNDVMDATPIRTARRALAGLAVASLGFLGTAAAQPPGGQGLAPGNSLQAQLPQRRQLTLGEAIQLAQSRYPGRVVRAQTIQ